MPHPFNTNLKTKLINKMGIVRYVTKYRIRLCIVTINTFRSNGNYEYNCTYTGDYEYNGDKCCVTEFEYLISHGDINNNTEYSFR